MREKVELPSPTPGRPAARRMVAGDVEVADRDASEELVDSGSSDVSGAAPAMQWRMAATRGQGSRTQTNGSSAAAARKQQLAATTASATMNGTTAMQTCSGADGALQQRGADGGADRQRRGSVGDRQGSGDSSSNGAVAHCRTD
ncbi:hypothetical protein Syun_017471 [Stephania yunnanensis]|uniref:Uncharacterized protein n=1 Tax=Stephania yunnanensis TaxID=152371 RepID=A0AAP0J745_9MAGN